jgi:hypothetical protein
VRPTSITVHIERLVLDGPGLAQVDGELVGTAVQAELERLFAANPTAAPVESSKAARSRPMIHTADPAALGGAIASAVHERAGALAQAAESESMP